MAPNAPLVVTNAANLHITEGKLGWQEGDNKDDLRLDDVFLVLDSASSPGTQVVCLIKEDPGNVENPWKLSFLRVQQDTLPAEVRTRHKGVGQLPPHLITSEGKRLDIIVSTRSGTGQALIFWDNILQPLLTLVWAELKAPGGFEDNVLVTLNADSVSDFAKGLADGNGIERTIVLLSGDGGVVELMNGIGAEASLPSTPTIALLPLGTGNALFHSMHKSLYSLPGPPSLGWALRTLFFGKNPYLPAFKASFPAGSNIIPPGTEAGAPLDKPVSQLSGVVVASYGFHASIVYESDTPEHRVHGVKRFGMVAQELLQESHPYEARVHLVHAGSSSEAELVPRDTHAYVLTTAVSNLEQAFTISPASRPLDGKLWTVHFGPLGGERTMEAMKAAYDNGKHVDLSWDDGQRIGYDQVDEIQIEILDEDERWRKVCIDGTIVGVPKGGKVTVRSIPQSPFRILISPEALP